MKTLLVLPRPSRFDTANKRILVGPARDLVDQTLGPAGYDVCYAAEWKARAANYTHIILTGVESLLSYQPNLNLDTHRGIVWFLGNYKLVATYWPQDCVDQQNYESGLGDDADDDGGNSKDRAPTARKNYRFWFQRDCAKIFNTPPAVTAEPYNLCDNEQAARLLFGARDSVIYFDIESNPTYDTLTCFSFAIDSGPTTTVLIYDYRGSLTPGAHKVMAALARAMSRNTFVIHNSFFDLLFLALYCGIPAGPRVEDTMLMGHRIWPEAEKSLAHHISLYVNAPYHKSDGGTWNPRSWAQQDQLLRYNAKDVTTLRAVHLAQRRLLDECGDAGLRDSVRQVNASIRPYLYASFHGLPYNVSRATAAQREYKHDAARFERLLKALVGQAMNPNSPKQLAAYFVDGLNYNVLGRTDSGAPITDEASLYRYLEKYHNPAIRVILRAKRAAKVAGALGFKPFTTIKGR